MISKSDDLKISTFFCKTKIKSKYKDKEIFLKAKEDEALFFL